MPQLPRSRGLPWGSHLASKLDYREVVFTPKSQVARLGLPFLSGLRVEEHVPITVDCGGYLQTTPKPIANSRLAEGAPKHRGIQDSPETHIVNQTLLVPRQEGPVFSSPRIHVQRLAFCVSQSSIGSIRKHQRSPRFAPARVQRRHSLIVTNVLLDVNF